MRLGQNGIAKLLVDYVFLDEVDERIGFRVDVVLVQQDFGELQNLAQTPGQWCDVVEQRFVVSERVQNKTFRSVGREILDAFERLGLDTELFLEDLVRLLDFTRLIEIAEIGTLDVEADRGNRSLVAVCFNVKSPDLCYLDKPGEVEKTDE